MREVEKRVERMRNDKDKAEDRAKRHEPPVVTMERPANGLPEDLREHTRLMCDIIAIGVPDRQDRASRRCCWPAIFRRSTIRSSTCSDGHHAASHNDLSDGYERITRFHLSQFAYLAQKLDAMPEGDGTVLDN